MFGLLYLIPFDLSAEEIVKNSDLEFEAMIRYVDDVTIILKNSKGLKNREIHRQLSNIEQRFSQYLNNELDLKINENKTIYKIIENQECLDTFLNENIKMVSNLPEEDEYITSDNIKEKVETINSVIEKYKFSETNDFKLDITKNDIEDLKLIFDENVRKKYAEKTVKNETEKLLKSIDKELMIDQLNILIVLFALKAKDKHIYLPILMDYLTENACFSDKRIIHMILLVLCQKDIELSKKLNKKIKANKEILLKDNYGKYILVLKKYLSIDFNANLLSDEGIFNQLIYEYAQNKKYTRRILHQNRTLYMQFINALLGKEIEEAIINQLKSFVYCFERNQLDDAFNHFQNIFHELSKELFELKDGDTVKKIISKAKTKKLINSKEEILIRKFYDRRNFNPVSHPSQNGKASIKISKEVLEEFMDPILEIMIKFIRAV